MFFVPQGLQNLEILSKYYDADIETKPICFPKAHFSCDLQCDFGSTPPYVYLGLAGGMTERRGVSPTTLRKQLTQKKKVLNISCTVYGGGWMGFNLITAAYLLIDHYFPRKRATDYAIYI